MEGLAGKLRKTLGPLPAAGPLGETLHLAQAEPRLFWTGFLAGLERERDLILMDPAWPGDWRSRLEEQLAGRPAEAGPVILVPTGGSSGLPRFCIHNSDTLSAAARGFEEKCGSAGILHAVNVLPPHHVGGLMPVFRAAACGGRVHFANYRDAASLEEAPFPLRQASLSLVPTQLRRMLAEPESRRLLQSFGQILLGGAGCPPDLLAAARELGLRLSPCFGSTETAAMVTLLDAEDFLSGVEGVGKPLPHARIGIGPDHRILIHSPSNLLGYWPASGEFSRDPLRSGDLGHLDAEGRLHVHGRADRVIITGGENVHPEQVEAAALSSGLVLDAFCTGEDDPEWGRGVVLEVVPMEGEFSEEPLREALRNRLPRYAQPKQIRLRAHIPRSELGKLRQPGAGN